MILKNISGKILVETRHKTIKSTLEYCAKDNIDLSEVSIRRAKIRDANLDGLIAPNSCFWGCDFSGSDMGYANFSNADFRCTNFNDVCFAQSNLCHADMRGAYFSKTLFDGTSLDEVKLSCPSFWGCDLSQIRSMQNLLFSHKGEMDIVLKEKPVILRHNGLPIVFIGEYCLWRNGLYPAALLPRTAAQELFSIKMSIEKMLGMPILRNEKIPMPKILKRSD